jgi:hypothetical protein
MVNKIKYEHVYFEKPRDMEVWFCYTPDEKISLGEILRNKEREYIYYQMYEAILTKDQLKDIVRFIESINPRQPASTTQVGGVRSRAKTTAEELRALHIAWDELLPPVAH